MEHAVRNASWWDALSSHVWGEKPPEPPPENNEQLIALITAVDSRLTLNETADALLAARVRKLEDFSHVGVNYTHKVKTDKPNGIKLRAWPNGSEAAMLKNGHPVAFLGQTRAGNYKLVAATVNEVVVSGWLHDSEMKK
jgi:hypothetical protein